MFLSGHAFDMISRMKANESLKGNRKSRYSKIKSHYKTHNQSNNQQNNTNSKPISKTKLDQVKLNIKQSLVHENRIINIKLGIVFSITIGIIVVAIFLLIDKSQ